MFIRETTSMIEPHSQETYASATRTRDDIQQSLTALIDDFSLSSVTVGYFEQEGWIN